MAKGKQSPTMRALRMSLKRSRRPDPSPPSVVTSAWDLLMQSFLYATKDLVLNSSYQFVTGAIAANYMLALCLEGKVPLPSDFLAPNKLRMLFNSRFHINPGSHDLAFHDSQVHKDYLNSPGRVAGPGCEMIREAIAGVHSAPQSSDLGASAVPPYMPRYGMGGNSSSYNARMYAGGVVSSTKSKGMPVLKDLISVIHERRFPNTGKRHPHYKKLLHMLLYPATAAPADAPPLHPYDEGVIEWARNEVGVQGDDPINKDFFRDDERATPDMILRWVMFFAKALAKIEDWSHDDNKQYFARLALPLPSVSRKHMAVDKFVFYSLLKLTQAKFMEELDKVNKLRKANGDDPISWASLGAPPLPAATKFVARPKAGGKSLSEQWLRFIFKIDKLFTPGSNKEYPFEGVFFYTDAVQICFLYLKKVLNEPIELTGFENLNEGRGDDDEVTDISIDEMLQDMHEEVDDCDDDEMQEVGDDDSHGMSYSSDPADLASELEDYDDMDDDQWSEVMGSLESVSLLSYRVDISSSLHLTSSSPLPETEARQNADDEQQRTAREEQKLGTSQLRQEAERWSTRQTQK